MASFYYYDLNPFHFSFHILIWLFQWGFDNKSPNLHKKAKSWRILVVVVKWRHHANDLFILCCPTFVPKHGDLERTNWRLYHCKLLKSHKIEKIETNKNTLLTYMQWAKSEDTIIHLDCSITNFSQTTLLSMVLHLYAWQMHVFLYFLGPTYFHLFFHVFFFFWWAVQKGGG